MRVRIEAVEDGKDVEGGRQGGVSDKSANHAVCGRAASATGRKAGIAGGFKSIHADGLGLSVYPQVKGTNDNTLNRAHFSALSACR